MKLSSITPDIIENGQFRIAFSAMGTNCEISYTATSENQAFSFREKTLNWINYFENRYSRYLPKSLISKINNSAGIQPVKITEEDYRLFNFCDTLHFLTKGIFDPTTLPLSKIWDFKSKNPTVPPKFIIEKTLSKIGWKKVVFDEDYTFLPESGMGIDLGGFGKEYAVDRVIELAKEHEISSALVNLGGDVRSIGSPPNSDFWRIGIEDPNFKGHARFALIANNLAVATSGNYQRYFESNGVRYGHLLNHQTGYPTTSSYLSASVVAKTCLEAGILSTCSLLDGKESGLKIIEDYFGAEGCLWTKNGISWSKNFTSHIAKN